jgi:hypothetical protein
MKIRIITAIFLISTLFIGCKNEKSVDELEVDKPTVVENFFKVKLKFIAKKDDNFCLFYSEDGTTNFNPEAIWNDVKGQADIQTIEYNLPNDVYPTQLRLDFGMKKEQEDIVLKGVILEYNGKIREILGAELGLYFRADETKCTFDPGTGIIKALIKDGQRQNPSLYPHEKVLKAEIEKLAI